MHRFVLATLLALCLCATSSAARSGTSAVPLVTISANIRVFTATGAYNYPGRADFEFAPRNVTFSPDLINVGRVHISIHNLDVEPHALEIGGVLSKTIGPGGRAVVTVTFRRAGVYNVSLISDELQVAAKGVLHVIK